MRIASILSNTSRLAIAAMVVVACWHAAASAQIPCRYEVSPTIIQAPPCPFIGPPPIAALCVSPSGRYICGHYNQCDTGRKAFYYDTTTSQFVTLPFPSGVISMEAEAVNDMGLVAGTWVRPIGLQQRYRGFVYTIASGQYVELLPLDAGGDCVVSGMNASGQVCGTRAIGSPSDPMNPQTAFIWQNKFTDLGLINNNTTIGEAINDNGWVTGSVWNDQTITAFLWKDRQVVNLGSLAGLFTSPAAVNNNLEVVGGSAVPDPGSPSGIGHAFLWESGQMIDLGTLPGNNVSGATRISTLGAVGGVSATGGASNNRAFLRFGSTMRPLTEFTNLIPDVTGFGSIAGFRADHGIVANANAAPNGAVVILNPVLTVQGDTNADCLVNIDDLVMVITEWGQTTSVADLNHNSMVDIDDLVIVVTHWTTN